MSIHHNLMAHNIERNPLINTAGGATWNATRGLRRILQSPYLLGIAVFLALGIGPIVAKLDSAKGAPFEARLVGFDGNKLGRLDIGDAIDPRVVTHQSVVALQPPTVVLASHQALDHQQLGSRPEPGQRGSVGIVQRAETPSSKTNAAPNGDAGPPARSDSPDPG